MCTPECLPDPAEGPRVGVLRFGVRLGSLAAMLLLTLAGVPLLRGRARERWLQAFCSRALRAAGVRLRRTGGERLGDRGGALIVANHLSWVDVLAMYASAPVRMQAKREVREWPVLGPLSARTGALFVDRAGLRALPTTVAETADALRGGSVVAVFPEGTTWCGTAAGRFRRAAFQSAIDAGVPVQPVAFVLRLPDGRATAAAAFVGEQTLWDSLRRVLTLPGLVCDMTVLEPIAPGAAHDRRELARRAAEAVDAVTGVPHHGPRIPRAAPVLDAAAAA